MSINNDQYRLPSRTGLGSGRVIVCETSGRWAVTLGRELRPCCRPTEDFCIEQTRSVAECWQRLDNAPAAFVVVELTRGNIDAWLDRMTELECSYPLARVAVVVRHDPLDNACLSRYQWLAREAGAVFVGTSLRAQGLFDGEMDGEMGGARFLADVVCRHLHREPRPQKSVSEEIWDNLPWRKHE